MAQTPNRPKRKSASRKKRGKQTGFWTRLRHLLFGTTFRSVLVVAVVLFIAFYGYVFFNYIVSPFTSRWRALYGDVNFPSGYSIHGIDVSHHQGTIDWERLAEAQINDEPIVFVMIKATEGKSLLDENFNENFYQARQYGMIRGAYHFFSPTVSGKKQAQYYLHQVHLDDGDLPPILDIEEKGMLSVAELQKQALEWLHLVEERYEVPPIIYTGLKFKESYLSTPEFERYPFWIAHYYVKEVGYKGEWRFWQHTDLGHVAGIRGPVDLNIYNGSMYDLRHFTIGRDEEPEATSAPDEMQKE